MNRKMVTIIFIMVAITAACSLPFTIESVDDRISFLAEQTVQAWQTQNAPTETPVVLPTLEPLPTLTPYPTYTPVATSTARVVPTSTPNPCNQAAFVSETILDGTKFTPGEEFVKSWRLKNIGTCTWNPNYKLVFYSGDQMSGPTSVKLNGYVKPGEKIDVLVDLKAPTKPGTYTGYWRLQSDDGFKFAQVFVQIKVPSAAFAVTSVKLISDPASYNGACPKTFTVKADITTSAAGKVTYRWERSDGYTSGLLSRTFDAKGTKSVQFDWELNSTDTHWVRIYIDSPNNQWFGPIDIDVTCL